MTTPTTFQKPILLTGSTMVVALLLTFVTNVIFAQSITLPKTDPSSVSIYPNPSKEGEQLFISLANIKEKEVLVVLYDLLGNEVFSKVVITDNGSGFAAIDPSHQLEPGIYIVVGTSKKELFKQKLIVKKY